VYRRLFHHLLAHVEPELAHRLAAGSLRAVRATVPGRMLLALALGAPDPALRIRALGRTFASPLGIAAGLDKDATWFAELGALGFGFVEVGTLTARPQSGNPRPRIVRLPAQRALVNRMGFPNRGALAAARRLAGRPRSERGLVVGVNIGRSKAASDELADYRAAVRALAPHADYLVLNVSSPNTPGLRELQATERLLPLLAAVRAELAVLEAAGRVAPPLLVKLGPDLERGVLAELAAASVELELDGIVAVNTSVERSLLPPAAAATLPFEGGGISGAPLAARALEALQVLRAAAGPELTLISAGGVMGAADVLERLRAGATLVQAYTGFVYGGPAWPAQVNRELAGAVRAAGHETLQGWLAELREPGG
jgi:dihydroorotate dehydrogenase